MLTVLTPATNRRLTTVANLRLDLGLAAAPNPTDSSLERYIDQASSAIELYCNRIFARETLRETFPCSTGEEWIMLARFPIYTLTSLSDDAVISDPATYQVVTDSGFVYHLNDEGERTLWGYGAISVDFIAGYALPGDPDYSMAPLGSRLPAIIERAVTMEVAALRNGSNLTRDPALKSHTVEGIGSKTWQTVGGSAGAGSVDTGGFANPSIMSMLDPFRVRNI